MRSHATEFGCFSVFGVLSALRFTASAMACPMVGWSKHNFSIATFICGRPPIELSVDSNNLSDSFHLS